MRGAEDAERIPSVLFACLIALNLLGSTMAQMNTAGSPLLTEKEIGSSAYGGVLVAVFVAASTVSRIASGNLADRFSRKAVLVSGAWVYVAGSLIAVFAPSLIALLPARLLQGWGFAAVHTAASTCAADVLPRSRLGEGIGYYSLGQALAMATGPMLAIWLVGMEFRQALAVGAAALACLVLLLSRIVSYEKDPRCLPESAGYREARVEREGAPSLADSPAGEDGGLGALARMRMRLGSLFEASALRGGIPLFIISGAITFFLSFATIFAEEQGYANPSAFYLVASATAIAVRFVASRLFDSEPPLAVFLVPVGAGALALAGIFFVRAEAVYDLCGIGYGVCLGFSIPLLNSMAVKLADPRRWGAANALFLCLYDAGIGIAAIAWGALRDALGFPAVFTAAAISLAFAFLSAALLFPREKAPC